MSRCYIVTMITFAKKRANAFAIGAALVLPPAVCAALIPARASLPNTDAALGLVALIVAVAVLGNRIAGWLAATGTAV